MREDTPSVRKTPGPETTQPIQQIKRPQTATPGETQPREPQVRRPEAQAPEVLRSHGGRALYVARNESDGTYNVALTREGIRTFESALALADDLGPESGISSRSTLRDVIERNAAREDLSKLTQTGAEGSSNQLLIRVLRRRVWGSEKVTVAQRVIGHIVKGVIVGIVALWALMQFITAVHDIQDIPGIVAGIPRSILQFHATSPLGQVGNAISDAGMHVLYGIVGVCLFCLAVLLIHPFSVIYRKDQILPGERFVLRSAEKWARRSQEPDYSI